MKVKITLTTAVFPKGQFVQWTVLDPSEAGAYTFTLERAGAPAGPWDVVWGPAAEQYAVLDAFDQRPETLDYSRPNQLTLYDRVYYRVTCTTPSGAVLRDVVETGPSTLNPRMAGYRRKLIRDFRLSLKFNGTPTVLLKRRTWGVRCDRCVDKRTKQIVRSECRDCWGTGFEGGYWAPILTYARRSVTAPTVVNSPEQKSESNDAQIWLPDFPQMERDDVIVSLHDQRRYRVDRQVQTEVQLAGVHQVLTCQELARDHVIYRYAVSPNTLQPLY